MSIERCVCLRSSHRYRFWIFAFVSCIDRCRVFLCLPVFGCACLFSFLVERTIRRSAQRNFVHLLSDFCSSRSLFVCAFIRTIHLEIDSVIRNCVQIQVWSFFAVQCAIYKFNIVERIAKRSKHLGLRLIAYIFLWIEIRIGCMAIDSNIWIEHKSLLS